MGGVQYGWCCKINWQNRRSCSVPCRIENWWTWWFPSLNSRWNRLKMTANLEWILGTAIGGLCGQEEMVASIDCDKLSWSWWRSTRKIQAQRRVASSTNLRGGTSWSWCIPGLARQYCAFFRLSALCCIQNRKCWLLLHKETSNSCNHLPSFPKF